ncbi:hypothetical protein [Rhodoblastus sp.]|uniref:hypothetical protein n=1 Tax=Rhodoblastus sp. TaxID=1962975 RepID=UPI003F98BA84
MPTMKNESLDLLLSSRPDQDHRPGDGKLSDAFSKLSPQEAAEIELDVIGILNGTDKGSIRSENRCSWDYLRHYAREFLPIRDAAINIIEIGVAGGASLKTWPRYFPNATAIGIDIEPSCARFSGGPIKVRIGSQDDEKFLTQIVKEFPPTIIVDDGSHQSQHMITSFEILFPSLLSGGIYIIEDLAFHFSDPGPHVSATSLDNLGSPVLSYLMRIIATKAAYVMNPIGAEDRLKPIYSDIDSLNIVGGAIIIRKRAERKWESYIPVFEKQLRERAFEGVSQYGHYALRFAEFLITYNVAVERAVTLLEEILLSNPKDRRAAGFLRAALKALGRGADADQVAAKVEAAEQELVLPLVARPTWMPYPH